MPIDQQGAQPLSAQVRDDIRRRIAENEFPVGAKIPSLRTLAGDYGVAELTVHTAIKELQYEGVLESASGRGTFVRAMPSDAVRGVDVVAALDDVRAELADLRSRVEAIEQTKRRR